jgi:putative transposase
MSKYLNKYRNESARIKNYDYGTNGLYFVTINTLYKTEYFYKYEFGRTDDCPSTKNDYENNIWTDNRPSLRITEIGVIANEYWQQIPQHYPWVELDAYVIMPDHIHGILLFNKPDENGWNPNKFGVQSRNLGAVIRAYKSSVKRYANQHQIEFNWQPRFHDTLIHTQISLLNIRHYILQNPAKWLQKHSK